MGKKDEKLTEKHKQQLEASVANVTPADEEKVKLHYEKAEAAAVARGADSGLLDGATR